MQPLEELSFVASELEAWELVAGKMEITAEYMTRRLQAVVLEEDLSRFLLWTVPKSTGGTRLEVHAG
ncbi:MAG: hypothetical protein ACK49R_11765 [Planctomycetota bacterium]